MAVPANQPRQGGVGLPTVVYLALEDREWRVQQRMQELTDSPPENLRFGFSCGQLGAELEGQIEETLREFPTTGLIFIDTLQMVRDNTSAKVNAYAQDYKDLSGLKKLADDHGICIFVVHHTRKERDSSNIFNPRSVTANFSKLLEQNGPRHIRFHDLRHSCASLLLANDVPLKQIQEWLGHSDIGTTANIYSHLGYKSKITSANVMDNILTLPDTRQTGWHT